MGVLSSAQVLPQFLSALSAQIVSLSHIGSDAVLDILPRLISETLCLEPYPCLAQISGILFAQECLHFVRCTDSGCVYLGAALGSGSPVFSPQAPGIILALDCTAHTRCVV